MHVALYVGSHRRIAQLVQEKSQEGIIGPVCEGEDGEDVNDGGLEDVGVQTSFLAREDNDTKEAASGGETADKRIAERKRTALFFPQRVEKPVK